jgi:hypothetical protein
METIESTAVRVRDNAPAPTVLAAPQLLDALRPAERVALMTEISNVIADVIEKKKWYTLISGKKHIRIEGWTFVGGLGGCSAKTTATEQIDGGYKAHAVVVRVDSGIEVGSAEQVCMKAEPFGRGKADYALVGMASTRACSRALSTVFRHVVELAGYSATPAEEMNAGDKPLGKDKTEPAEPTKAEQLVERAIALGVLDPLATLAEQKVALRAWAGDRSVASTVEAITEALDAVAKAHETKPAEPANDAPAAQERPKTTCVGPGGCGGPHTEAQHAKAMTMAGKRGLAGPKRYAAMTALGLPDSIKKCDSAQIGRFIDWLERP